MPCRCGATRLDEYNQTTKPCSPKTELEQLPVCRYVVLVDECSVVGKSQKLCGSLVSHRGAGQCVFWSTQRQHTTADLKFPSEARLLRVSIVCVHALHKNTFSLLQSFFFLNSHDGRDRKFAKIGSSDVWARMTTVLRHGGALKQLIEASRMQAWLCIIPTLSQADVL